MCAGSYSFSKYLRRTLGRFQSFSCDSHLSSTLQILFHTLASTNYQLLLNLDSFRLSLNFSSLCHGLEIFLKALSWAVIFSPTSWDCSVLLYDVYCLVWSFRFFFFFLFFKQEANSVSIILSQTEAKVPSCFLSTEWRRAKHTTRKCIFSRSIHAFSYLRSTVVQT